MDIKEIFVAQPSMPPFEEYVETVKPLWHSRWLTNMGILHQELEEQLGEYLDVPELSLMVNGHMALELVIQAMDFPRGSEVITTPFTFISTTHAIIRNGLIPVFCDVKPEDGTIDEEKIEGLVTEKTAAILPVHVYGNVCSIEAIENIAHRHGLKVIYDAAHAFGVTYKGKGIGNFGDASVFSFHATKVFNTVEGGAVTFQDPALHSRLYNLKNFGIRGEELVEEVGTNAKMNEFCAAMGLCNLRHVGQAIARRRELCREYERLLEGVSGIRLLWGSSAVKRNYGYFPVIVQGEYPLSRNELYKLLGKYGIHARKYFYPLTSDHACFAGRYQGASLECARYLAERVLALPVHEGLEVEDVGRVVAVIRSGVCPLTLE